MGKLTLRATIHETPAALRFGGDGAFVTFAVPECDLEKAAALIALKKTALKLIVEIDNGEGNSQEGRAVWPTVQAKRGN